MNYCPTCKNPMKVVYKKVHMGLGKYKSMPSDMFTCPYCDWKGDTGLGKQIRGMGLNPDFRPNGKAEWDKSIKDATALEEADSVPWDRAKRKIERRACLDAIRGGL